MKTLFKLTLLLAPLFSFGQATEILDKNNVSLIASADGYLFTDASSNSAGYEIPKGSGMSVIYAQNLWFGAKEASGQLRIAAQRYDFDSTDFFPGPYSSNNAYNDPNYVNEYIPALWKVSKADIDNHTTEYASTGSVLNPHPTILNWPANGDPSLGTAAQLAPFIDQNFDGIYDPYGGDCPDIKGCEGLYIIMNDSKDVAGGTGTPNMDIEIHILMYQYAAYDFLNNITFMDVRVINRGATDLSEFVSATFVDADIGNYSDDYMGCDPVRNVMYMYNGDYFDESNTGIGGYGDAPPALGVMYLNQTMTHTGYFTSMAAGPQNDPVTADQYWNYMNGKWSFGDDWLFGGTGFPGSVGGTNIPTNHMFPGANDPTYSSTGGVDPGFDWAEENQNNPVGDRRMFGTAEHGTFVAGAEIEIHQAIVYGRDTTKNSYENVDVMLAVADSVQLFYDGGLDDCNDPFASINPISNQAFSVFPNPTQGKVTVEVPNYTSGMQLNVVDVFGKLVYSAPIDTIKTEIDLNERSGLYFVTISGNEFYSTTKLVLE